MLDGCSYWKGLRLRFDELFIGDRFVFVNTLWTKVDPDAARKHSKSSIALAAKGFGYVGDTICSFERNDKVDFVPVSQFGFTEPKYEIRQMVHTIQKRWLEVVSVASADYIAKMDYERLVAEHPNVYFELVKITHKEECLAFTPLTDDKEELLCKM